MAYVMAAMAAVSVLSSVMGGSAAAREADRRREAEVKSARANYASTESSINIMKAAGREQAKNAIGEVLQAGAEASRDTADQIQNVTSKVQASSEGLTSGRSKGKQMVSLMVEGNKAMQGVDQQSRTVVSQITDAQDKQMNDLNNKLFAAHQDMTSVLTTPGATYNQNPLEVVSAGFQGAAIGASLGNSFGGASTSSTNTSSSSGTRYSDGTLATLGGR